MLGQRFRGQGEAVCAHQHRRVDPARHLHGSRGLRCLAETSVEPAEPRRAVPSGGRPGGEEWICQVHRLSCVYGSTGLFWELRSRIIFSLSLSLICRVGTPLAYFISGQLFAHSDTLTNLRTIPLHVLTLPVWKESPLANLSPSHPPSSSSPSHPLPPLLATAECELNRLLSSGSQSWILDVDLDFFSTANPFRDDFSQVRKNFPKFFIFLMPKFLLLSGGIFIAGESVQV